MAYMKKITIAVLFGTIVLLAACYNDNISELYPKTGTQTGTCDSTNVTYTSPIKAFFDGKCIGCHNPGGSKPNPSFNTYAGVQAYVAANGMALYNKVAGGTHNGIVLSACEKAQLKKWISLGAPN